MRVRHLLLASLAIPLTPLAAQDQVQDQAQAEPADDDGKVLVVTGTRRTDRTVLESSAPVDVFTAEDFRAQPAPQLQTILQTLVPSFNQQRNLLGDASAFVRPPTLRGLPSDQILVLLNGKRMHRSALVQVAAGALNAGAQGADLSQISSPAVGRVEVLRDGAAAQYGSDAIAGVINIGLRRDTGYEVTARYGQSYEGDGEDTQITAFYGAKLGDNGGFFNITGEFINQEIFDRSVPRPTIAGLARLGIITDLPTGNRLGGPENNAYRATVNTEIPAGDATFYAFANYGYQRQGNDFNLRVPVSITHDPIPGRPGTATTGRSVNPVFLDRIGFDAQGRPQWDLNGATFNLNDDNRFPTFRNGFVPFFEATNEDVGIVAGIKGEEWGINYDFSLMYGTNQIKYFMSDTVNASLGPNSPTEFYMGKFVQKEFNFNADFNTTAEVGFAEPLFIAWGVEVRRESFEVGLGDRASWVVGPFATQRLFECRLAGAPVRCGTASRGFRPPTPGQQFSQNLSTGFPFGATVPQGIQTARPDSPIGRFYLAEPLSPEKSVNLSGGLVLQPGGGFSVTLDYYNIKVNDRIGISGQINPNVVNANSLTDAQFLLAQGVAEAAELGAVRYFTNAFDTRTQGFDFVATHKANTGWGQFNTSLAVNYNQTRVTDRKVINGTLASGRVLSNFQPVDDVRVGNIEGAVPAWRAVLSESYRNGMFDATARVNYFGSYTSVFDPITTGIGPTPTVGVTTLAQAQALYPVPFSKKFGAQASFDLEVGITFKDNYRLAVGAQNLFNTLPARETRNVFPSTGGAANGSIYNDFAPIGQLGGFWYIRTSARF